MFLVLCSDGPDVLDVPGILCEQVSTVSSCAADVINTPTPTSGRSTLLSLCVSSNEVSVASSPPSKKKFVIAGMEVQWRH